MIYNAIDECNEQISTLKTQIEMREDFKKYPKY
jgi:hypothetical protein